MNESYMECRLHDGSCNGGLIPNGDGLFCERWLSDGWVE